MKRLNQNGFSLVELMVVVAIIGILATVAIPRVNKFIAKARTSEAQSNLSSLYTFDKNFYVEYSGYTSDFGVMGFIPEGRLRYNLGWAANAGVPANYGNSGKTYVASFSNTKASCTDIASAAYPCLVLAGADNAVAPDLAGTAMAADFSTFTAVASAVLVKGSVDTWTMSESKNMQNTADGTQ